MTNVGPSVGSASIVVLLAALVAGPRGVNGIASDTAAAGLEQVNESRQFSDASAARRRIFFTVKGSAGWQMDSVRADGTG
jgi:hypothetical protein